MVIMKKDGSLHSGHWERIRHKILSANASTLTEAEALEAVLQFVFTRGDTNEIACRLLKHFGNFSNVMMARPDELTAVDGIGIVAAEKICMLNKILDFYRLNEAQRCKNEVLKTPADCAKIASKILANLRKEKMYMFITNDKNILIKTILLAEGEESEVRVNISDIVVKATNYSAKHVIFAHNHPNGTQSPSSADIKFTQRAYDMLRLSNIRLIDHIIISNGAFYSFRSANIINEFDVEYVKNYGKEQ